MSEKFSTIDLALERKWANHGMESAVNINIFFLPFEIDLNYCNIHYDLRLQLIFIWATAKSFFQKLFFYL